MAALFGLGAAAFSTKLASLTAKQLEWVQEHVSLAFMKEAAGNPSGFPAFCKYAQQQGLKGCRVGDKVSYANYLAYLGKLKDVEKAYLALDPFSKEQMHSKINKGKELAGKVAAGVYQPKSKLLKDIDGLALKAYPGCVENMKIPQLRAMAKDLGLKASVASKLGKDDLCAVIGALAKAPSLPEEFGSAIEVDDSSDAAKKLSALTIADSKGYDWDKALQLGLYGKAAAKKKNPGGISLEDLIAEKPAWMKKTM